ncbi:MAG: hypothetical protein CW338_07065 [Clostridiales bacterium]|nr:hypothetical protein [Clostridiales bacterium]
MRRITAVLALVMALMMGISCAFAEVDPVVLAHYTFDDAENLGADSSGNGNDLVRRINPDAISAVEGMDGGAVYFAGNAGMIAADTANNDFIDVFSDADGSNSITVSFYAKADLANMWMDGYYRVVDCGINGNEAGFSMVINPYNSDLALSSLNITGTSGWFSNWAAVDGDMNDWHHYVMVYDAENTKVVSYVDDTQVAETAAGTNEVLNSPYTFCVGGNWAQWDWFNGGNRDATMNGFIGAVDEVMVVAGAVYDMEFFRNAPPPVEVTYKMIARPDNSSWDRNGSEPLTLTVAYFDSEGHFEKLDKSFIDRIKLNDEYIDASAIKVVRNADQTLLKVTIDAGYLKEHCAEGANTLSIYYEPDTYYHMTAVFSAN